MWGFRSGTTPPRNSSTSLLPKALMVTASCSKSALLEHTFTHPHIYQHPVWWGKQRGSPHPNTLNEVMHTVGKTTSNMWHGGEGGTAVIDDYKGQHLYKKQAGMENICIPYVTRESASNNEWANRIWPPSQRSHTAHNGQHFIIQNMPLAHTNLTYSTHMDIKGDT